MRGAFRDCCKVHVSDDAPKRASTRFVDVWKESPNVRLAYAKSETARLSGQSRYD
jgi:hypothetical protein